MANEAILKLRLEEPWDWIVPNAEAFEKGALCKMSGTGIAGNAIGSGDLWAGVARREKIASDGRTRLALFRRGIMDMVCNGGEAISQGDWVTNSGVNLIRVISGTELVEGKGIGIAREDIAINATGEIILGGY